jgi:hypothetical protein
MIPVNIKEKATYHSCVIAQVQYTMSLFKFLFSFQVLSIILVRLILVRMPPSCIFGLESCNRSIQSSPPAASKIELPTISNPPR